MTLVTKHAVVIKCAATETENVIKERECQFVCVHVCVCKKSVCVYVSVLTFVCECILLPYTVSVLYVCMSFALCMSVLCAL